MSVVSGGDLKELTLHNADAGSKTFAGLKGEDSTYMLPGYANTSSFDGAGRLVVDKENTPGSLEATVSNDMSSSMPEFEFLRACSNSTKDIICNFTNANGITYQGSGAIEGEISLNAKKSTIAFKMLLSTCQKQ